MKKSELSVVERTKAFVDWLSPQVSSKQLRDFFLITSAIDDYGKQHKQFKESMFELDDPERAQQFRKIIQNDKRFLFVHYGKSRAILLWLQKYCEFLQLQSEREPEKPKSIPSVSVSQEQKPATPVKKSGSVVLRTKSGATYYGDSCAEVLASFCEYLAKKYSKVFQRVIGEQYYGQGSVVLHAAEPAGGGIKVNQGNCYVDASLGKSAVEYYAKWLCKMCGELDLPVSLTVSEKKSEAEGQKQQTVVSAEKTEAKKVAAPVVKQEAADNPAAPLWRDQAQSAVPAVSAKREEAAKPVSGLDADLEALLAGKEYAQLRDELVSQKVTSLAQFKALDLWSFMNWAGLYSIGRRQEICKQIKAMLDALEDKEEEKQYCLKTVNGNCYYGSSPAKALAALYDHVAPKSPLTIRKLIGQRYNGIGMVVLYPDMPKTGGIQLTNPVAYLEKNLSERVALYYGIWLCRKCRESDEPVSLTEVAKQGTADKSTTKQPKPQEKPPVMVEEKEDDTTGEAWLFKMLADQGIQYEDKRDNQGCLWIYGGHELDQFVKLCVKKGYRFFYKADGYKAFKKGPAWWTVNRGAKGVKPVKGIPDNADKQKTKPVSGQGKVSLRDMIAIVLNESKRPMSAAEIVTEIKKKQFFKFSPGNPNMMVDYEIRKHCAGVYASGHVPESECIFGRMNDGKGIAQYYLLEYKVLVPEGEIENNPPIEDHSPVTSYVQKQIEQAVLEADLAGITKDALAAKVKMSLAATKKEVNANNNIVEICEKLIHKDAFVDWDQAADQLEKILDKLMTKNNGYVSKASLYEFARADMQMFMNDNDMDDQSKIYDMAVHLFSKEHYHGITYAFSNWQHISRPEVNLSTNLSVMINYAREQGGFFKLEDLISYLESVKIGTGNLHVQMKIYDKPIFLFYAEHEYVLAETMGINNGWLLLAKRAFDKLFMDMGDHVVLRNIQPVWYYQLPPLPNGRPWTALLLQSVLRHYSKDLDGVHTIYALSNQSGDVLHAMVVTADSEVQTFPDAIISVLVDEHIEKRQFDAEELRKLLLQRGLIEGNELMWTMPKATANDSRFIWSSNGQTVTINI